MGTRKLAAKVAAVVMVVIPLTAGAAQADGKSVADYVHATMADQEERGGCEWGRIVSGAGSDNRQNPFSNSPLPCK